MAAFNTRAHIGVAIDSILNQSVSDWELVVIDDGSTDDTADVARQFKDPRIRILTQTNQGPSAARNRGIRESKGDMIMFFDSDDRLRSRSLERLGVVLARCPHACVAYGECVAMDDQGYVFGNEKKPIFSYRPSGNVLKYFLQGLCIPSGAALIRTRCFDVSGFFREDLIGAEDWELWCRMATVGEFLYVGAEPTVEYRLRSDSISRNLHHDIVLGRLFRSIDEVFSNQQIAKHCSKSEWSRFRRRREADAFAWIGTEQLKKRNWKVARYYFLRSLRCSSGNPRVMILLGFVLSRWLPYVLERRLK